MKRKLVAGLLAMAVAMTMLLPVSAFAEELPAEPAEVVQQDEKAQGEVVEETKDEFVEESEDQAVGETEGEVVEETQDETVEEPKDEVVEKTEDEVVEETEDEMVEATEDEAVQATEEQSVAVQPSLLSAVSLLSGDTEQSEIYIDDNEDLIAAIKGQADGQTWIFTKADTYDVNPAGSSNDYEAQFYKQDSKGFLPDGSIVSGSTDYSGNTTGFVFPIYVDNLTITVDPNVEGQVVLTSSAVPSKNDGGNWPRQSFMIISGSGVTIEGVTLLPNRNEFCNNNNDHKLQGNQCDKAIETVGDAGNLTLRNVVISPLEVQNPSDSAVEGTKRSGSIYFSHAWSADKTVTLENVYTYGGIKSANNANILLNGVTENFEGNTYASYYENTKNYAWNPGIRGNGTAESLSNVTVGENGFKIIVDDSIDFRQIFNDSLLDGSTIQMQEGTYEIGATLNINSSVNIVGAGADKTIFQATAEPAVLIQVAGGDVDFSMSGVYVKGCEENTHENSSALMIGSGSLSSTGTISIEDCKFTDFTKNSITVKGGTANITRNEIVCKGYPGAAGNGIQVDMGAEATISNNKISGYASQNSTWSATGVLALRDGKVTELTGNTLQNCDAAVSLSTVYDEGDTASIPAPAAIMSANTFTGCDTSVSYQLDTEGNLAEILKNAQPGTSVSLYGSYTLDSDVTVKDGVSLSVGNGTEAQLGKGTLTVDSGVSLTVAQGGSLSVDDGTTLTNSGTLTNNGEMTNYGTVSSTGSFVNNGQITSVSGLPNVTGGGTVTTTAFVKTEEDLKTAVNNGGIITLGDDITLTSAVEVPEGKTVVINGEGHEIALSSASWSGGSYAAFNQLTSVEGLKKGTSLTVNNVKFTGHTSEQKDHAVMVGTTGGVTVDLNDCTFTNLYDAVYCNQVTDANAAVNKISISGTFNNVAHAYGVDDGYTTGARVDKHEFDLTGSTNAPDPEPSLLLPWMA